MEKTYTIREMREIVKQYNIEAARVIEKYQGYDIPQIDAIIAVDNVLPVKCPYSMISADEWKKHANMLLKNEVDDIIETIGYNLQVPAKYMSCEYIVEYWLKTQAFFDYYNIIAKYFGNMWKE